MSLDLPEGVPMPAGEWYVTVAEGSKHPETHFDGMIRTFQVVCSETGVGVAAFSLRDPVKWERLVGTERAVRQAETWKLDGKDPAHVTAHLSDEGETIESVTVHYPHFSPWVAHSCTIALAAWLNHPENKGPEEESRIAGWKGCDSVRIPFILNSLRVLLPRIPILVWDTQIQNVAQKGHEAFMDHPVPPELITKEAQLWYQHDGEYFLGNDRAHWDANHQKLFELPVPCEIQSMILLPARGMDPEKMDRRYPLSTSFTQDMYTGRWGITMGFVFVATQNFKDTPYFLRFLPAIYTGDTVRLPFHACMAASLKFLSLPFVGTQEHKLPRPERRRLARAGKPEPCIRTVILRKRERFVHGVAPTEMEWSCQWLVSGHWRRLHQPRKDDGAETTYVTPYVKGPEDKPFKMPAKVIHKVSR